MMLRYSSVLGIWISSGRYDAWAPEAEALYRGNARKGFGVSILIRSTMPLGSTALPRSLPGHIAQEVE